MVVSTRRETIPPSAVNTRARTSQSASRPRSELARLASLASLCAFGTTYFPVATSSTSTSLKGATRLQSRWTRDCRGEGEIGQCWSLPGVGTASRRHQCFPPTSLEPATRSKVGTPSNWSAAECTVVGAEGGNMDRVSTRGCVASAAREKFVPRALIVLPRGSAPRACFTTSTWARAWLP
jgi:hypothetical protein